MKKFKINYSVFFILFTSLTLTGIILPKCSEKGSNNSIQELISKVNIDSLEKYIKDLSGVNMVNINDHDTIISSRLGFPFQNYNYQNDLATEYLIETLEKTNLMVEDDVFDETNGRNVLAYQIGTKYPNEYYILCAHYDAVSKDDFDSSLGADDNASGTAAVLETARILSSYKFPYSIIYALWDKEEAGILGSSHFAAEFKHNNIQINGVINLDMIGYNTSINNEFLILTDSTSELIEFANYIVQFCKKYDLSLTPFINLSLGGLSDHRSFLENDYNAVLLIEPIRVDSENPFIHTTQDEIDKFNMDFFHEMSKLALGIISSFALEN